MQYFAYFYLLLDGGSLLLRLFRYFSVFWIRIGILWLTDSWFLQLKLLLRDLLICRYYWNFALIKVFLSIVEQFFVITTDNNQIA